MNHAGATGVVVRALVQTGVLRLVAAGSDNGTLSRALEAALIDAQAAGVRVMRASPVRGAMCDCQRATRSSPHSACLQSKRGSRQCLICWVESVRRPMGCRAVVFGQLSNAASTRSVISSTLPVPLMLRYLGASGAPLSAQDA